MEKVERILKNSVPFHKFSVFYHIKSLPCGINRKKPPTIKWKASLRKVENMQYIISFITGGIICIIGQLLIDKTALTPARILTGFVVAGVVLTAVGIYQPFVEFAGAGATVPISGFGYLMAKGVEEAVRSDGALGILTGAFTACAGGIAAAVIFSVIAAVISRAKGK